ncbi:hypothetical protein E4U47_002697 [Claviceps purpurea]|nr:hypothetical protein E4U47_002697 [Claviceps purpurea]
MKSKDLRAIKLLEDHGFTLQHDIEEDTGRLTSMSCVHPQSLKDFLKAPEVLPHHGYHDVKNQTACNTNNCSCGGLTCSAASGVTKEIHAVAI